MWDQLVDAVAEVTAAHPAEARRRRRARRCAASTRRSCPSMPTRRPVAPMLMWQDQRGTDHSFEIMSPPRGRVHDLRSSGTASRRSAAGCRSGTSSTCSSTGPTCTRRPTAYLEAMDYVTARLTGRITASQHTSFMVQCCDNRVARCDLLRRRADCARRGRPRPGCPPLVTRRLRRSARCCPTIAAALGLPAVGRRVRARQRHRGASRSPRARSRRAAPASRSARRACSSTASPTSAPTSSTRSCRCRDPYVDRYVVCAENGLGGKVARARARASRLRARRARRPPGRRPVRARSTPCSTRPTPARAA